MVCSIRGGSLSKGLPQAQFKPSLDSIKSLKEQFNKYQVILITQKRYRETVWDGASGWFSRLSI